MGECSWQRAVEVVAPYVVRVATPDGTGTGFLFAFAAGGGMCGIATAAHVVAHAHAWEAPIRIQPQGSDKGRLLRAGDRAVLLDDEHDAAAIVFIRDDIELPETLLPLSPAGAGLAVGTELGWVGYPAVAKEHLCFFGGRTSAWLAEEQSYLVDGVAINGVSGGPAFHLDGEHGAVLAGLMSAYLPNRATGKTLPGLSKVRHVGTLEAIVSDLRTMEDGFARQTPPEAALERATEPPAEL